MALVLAACGSGTSDQGDAAATSSASPSASPSPFAGQSADQILKAGVAAAQAATGVHVVGKIESKGDTLDLDLTMTQDAAEGRIASAGITMAVKRVGSGFFMSGDSMLTMMGGDLTGDPATDAKLKKLYKGKWIKIPATNKDFKDIDAFTSLKSFTDQAFEPGGTLTVVAGKDVDGVPTVGLRDDDPTEPGTLYIAATGKPYPLLLESADGKSTMTFTDWDKPATIKAPTAAEIMDIDKMMNP